MSTKMTEEVSCPQCGAAVETELWPGVDAAEHPELRSRVLDETMFDWTCPECGYRARFLYPFLYHDPHRRFLVYLSPAGEARGCGAADVEAEFPQFGGFVKRVVFSPEALKEKILIFESGLDDLAVELLKLALGGVLDRKYGKKTSAGYFCFADEEENRIGFSFLQEGETEPVRRQTRLDAYRRSLQIVKSAGPRTQGGFLPVDAVTARRVLDDYRGNEETEETEEEKQNGSEREE